MKEATASQSKEPAPPVKAALRALLVEDSEVDASMILGSLGKATRSIPGACKMPPP